MSAEILKKAAKEEIKKGALEKFLKGSAKYKLAVDLVDAMFKLAGFDLSADSSYMTVLSDDMITYILNICNPESIKTDSESNKLRLMSIMLLLIGIESYKSGDKVAEKISKNDKNHYKDEIEDYENRVGLLYLAKGSSMYESVEGIKNISNENAEEIKKLDFEKTAVDNDTATEYLYRTLYSDAAFDLIYNLPKYGVKIYNYGYIGIQIIDIDNDKIPEILYAKGTGTTGLRTADGIFAFDGNEYVELDMLKNDDTSFGYPVVARDDNGKVSCFSELNDVEGIVGLPFASYWYGGCDEVCKYVVSGNSVVLEKVKDFSEYSAPFKYGSETMEAWELYKSQVRQFNERYPIIENYPTSKLGSGTFIGDYSDDEPYPLEEALEIYHTEMDKDEVESALNTYMANVNDCF